ncbi:hypothetical protein [Actinophytocola sp.]|uniref:hypothetical protein n=1 Tax=Actinophytocola sp. TaxID=1872138 RepID=UPI003D6B5FE8
MTSRIDRDRFIKTYPSTQARAAAEHHYHWLTIHARPLRLPGLLRADGTSLEFIRVEGRHATPPDLVRIAAHLGDAHRAAWTSELHRARMDQPHPIDRGTTLSDFVSPRRDALNRCLDAGDLTDHDFDAVHAILATAVSQPVAFYKDTNPRNILITTAGHIVTVDVDDLTLAPFGYDLAKLIVTLAMTHGQLPDTLIHRALDAYNTAAARHGPRHGHVDLEHLSRYAALHHILTAPYIGRGGYRYPWPTVQPTAWQGVRP